MRISCLARQATAPVSGSFPADAGPSFPPTGQGKRIPVRSEYIPRISSHWKSFVRNNPSTVGTHTIRLTSCACPLSSHGTPHTHFLQCEPSALRAVMSLRGESIHRPLFPLGRQKGCTWGFPADPLLLW